MTNRFAKLSAWILPLLCGLFFLCSYHIAYLLSAAAGHVEWCFPYLQGCTSISAVGRQPPEELVFKGLMIPALSLSVIYWLICSRWLVFLSLGKQARVRLTVMSWLGVAGALMLMMYVLALGEYGDAYRMMRRTGVNLGAGFTYLAQLLLYGLVSRHCRSVSGLTPGLLRLWAVQLWVTLVIGVSAQICKALVADAFYRAYLEDPFEWQVIGLLCAHFFIAAKAWKSTGFAITVRSESKR